MQLVRIPEQHSSSVFPRVAVILAFAASGFITAFAGVVLGAKLQIGQSNVGPPYLLPSFVGALLGSTAFRLARVNVWGTIVAVVLLSVGIAGIEQMGSAFYVEPLFNGITLLIAVGLAGLTSRRQRSAGLVAGQRAGSGIDVEDKPNQDQEQSGGVVR